MAKKTASDHLLRAGRQHPCILGGSRTSGKEVDRVMLEFHRLMGRFLETQQEVMKAYLGGMTEESVVPLTGDFTAARLKEMAESTLKGLDQERGETEDGGGVTMAEKGRPREWRQGL